MNGQRDQALLVGNRLRVGRADIRKELRALDRQAGPLRMAELVSDVPPALASMYTFMLLQETPGIGEHVARKLLQVTAVDAWRRAGRLTPRQREALAAALRLFAERGLGGFNPDSLPGPRCVQCGEGPLRVAGLCGWCADPPVRSAA